MKLRYIDKKPIQVHIESLRSVIALPSEKLKNEITVNDREAKSLLMMRNGESPCFEVVGQKPEPRARRAEAAAEE